LFFAIQELSKLNVCYQFSVQAFMHIFLKNLDSKNVTLFYDKSLYRLSLDDL
jgi:hypothetical protein